MPDTPEGRITLAVIQEQLSTIRREMNEGFDRIDSCNKDHEDRIRAVEQAVIKLEQRIPVITGLLGTLPLIGSAVAAWLGSR